MFGKLNKVLLGAVLVGGIMIGSCVAMDYTQSEIKSMDDAVSFRDFSRDNTISNADVDIMIQQTESYYRTTEINRLDRAVSIIWKLDALCGHRLPYLRTVANNAMVRLVTELTEANAEYEIRLAFVLWNSQFDGADVLKSNLDFCVIKKIGELISRRAEPEAVDLKNTIVQKLSVCGYDLSSYLE